MFGTQYLLLKFFFCFMVGWISLSHQFVYNLIGCLLYFAQIWLSYQALWDLQADYLYGKLGAGLDCWMKALEDIKSVYFLAFLIFVMVGFDTVVGVAGTAPSPAPSVPKVPINNI